MIYYSALSMINAIVVWICIVAAPLPVLNSMTPMGEIFPNHREWTVEFNKQVLDMSIIY